MRPATRLFRMIAPLGAILLAAAALPAQVLVSGPPAPGLNAFDTAVLGLMSKWSIPGAALAITDNGHLIFAHGYGLADQEDGQPVQPDSLFRIASISKPFTAAAALKLIEQGVLQLNTTAFSVLSDLTPPPGATVDPRIYQITVQDLLSHTGGWDRNIAGDPPFDFLVTAAQTFNAVPPATPDLLIRYMMGQPLQYDPGTTYAYSNFGYIVLGAVIQRVSGQSYADFVTKYIMNPAGINRMQPGASLLSGRLPDEVKYYDYPGAPLASSAFPPLGALVPEVYGGFSTELMLANGGWIASPMDLLRYADNINGQLSQAFCNPHPPDSSATCRRWATAGGGISKAASPEPAPSCTWTPATRSMAESLTRSCSTHARRAVLLRTFSPTPMVSFCRWRRESQSGPPAIFSRLTPVIPRRAALLCPDPELPRWWDRAAARWESPSPTIAPGSPPAIPPG